MMDFEQFILFCKLRGYVETHIKCAFMENGVLYSRIFLSNKKYHSMIDFNAETFEVRTCNQITITSPDLEKRLLQTMKLFMGSV